MNLFLVFAFQREDDIVGKWVLLFAAVILVLLLVIYTYRRLRRHFAVRKQWTKAEATIKSGFSADVRDDDADGEDSFGWKPALQYFYQAAGEHYSGCFVLDRIFYSPDDARDAAQEWVDRKIFIRYNPANPEESAFLEQDGAPDGSHSLNRESPLSDLVTRLDRFF